MHLSAMSAWLGGLAMLLLAVPAATAKLDPPRRSRLLLALLSRFSPLALGGVVALATTGVVQAYVHVENVDGLFHSGYGRDILVKTGLLIVLIALGYSQRTRVMPALARLAGAGEPAGATGFRLRRVLRLEMLAVLAVIGVSAALADYTPPAIQESGPVNVSRRIGPAELEMTIEPALAGANEIHIYLLDAVNGSPYTDEKALTLRAALPSRGIGPEQIALEPAGPGHYVANGAVLAPAGDWRLTLGMRISEFDQFNQRITVPVR
jgi:copper transport protein